MSSFMLFKLLGKYKNFKQISCKVRNNMETTLNVNEFKFHKPGKGRN